MAAGLAATVCAALEGRMRLDEGGAGQTLSQWVDKGVVTYATVAAQS